MMCKQIDVASAFMYTEHKNVFLESSQSVFSTSEMSGPILSIWPYFDHNSRFLFHSITGVLENALEVDLNTSHNKYCRVQNHVMVLDEYIKWQIKNVRYLSMKHNKI